MQQAQYLDVWQQAHHLVLAIYRMSRHLPPHEQGGLVAQMRPRPWRWPPTSPRVLGEDATQRAHT